MVKFLTLGVMGWILTAVGWFLSPTISLLVNKFIEYLDPDTRRMLRNLESVTVPDLISTLRNLEEPRIMLTAAERNKGHERSESDLKGLEKLTKHLKSALYEAEDILDLVEYRKKEKTRARGGKSHRCSFFSSFISRCRGGLESLYRRVRHLFHTCINYCSESWFKKWIDTLRAMPRQWFQSLRNWMHHRFYTCITFFRESWFGQWINSTLETKLLPCLDSWVRPFFNTCITRCSESRFGQWMYTPRAALLRRMRRLILRRMRRFNRRIRRSSAQLLPRFFTTGSNANQRSLIVTVSNAIVALRSATSDWSYERLGQQEDEVAALSMWERIRLRKQIKCIEDTLTDSKQSHLLKQQSSSSTTTTKDTDRESRTSNNTNDTNKKIPRHTDKGTAEENLRITFKNSCNSIVMDTDKDSGKMVFGRKMIRYNISNLLREERDSNKQPYSVIGIYGITGSGKSTLAQYVCEYEKDETKHFDLIMFSHLSKNFNLGDIYCDMLRVRRKDLSEDPSTEEELKKKLEGKRFLLVLDDIWVNNDTRDGWESLRKVLDAGKSGSRILATAQSEEAIEVLGALAKDRIPIPDLDADKYLNLFMHHALQGAPDTDGKYTTVGSQIADKLHRSPIAAVAVAKGLQNKSIELWKETLNLSVLNETMGALWWSYQQLDPDTRQCFAYCSTFPKGYKLARDELVRMWIAQGFVDTNMRTEDDLDALGRRCFDQLLKSSFIQAKGTGLFGPEVFMIHDLLHTLAERIAVGDFFTIDVKGKLQDIPQEVRHLFIETNNRAEITEKILGLKNLRTLIIVEKYGSNDGTTSATPRTSNEKHDLVKERIFKTMFRKLKKLRVLKVEVKYDNKLVFTLPDSIGEMKHLRYLSFQSLSNLELIFPCTFSKLYHMQILDAYKLTFPCAEDMAGGLIDLRHSSSHLNFPNIGKLTSLQTMPRFVVRRQEQEGFELKQLEDLNNLCGTLMIEGLGLVGSKKDALEANLDKKMRLTSLKLDFGNEHICNPEVEAEILDGLSPPRYLEDLTIGKYNGSWYPSWMLSPEHPVTKCLILNNCFLPATIPEYSRFFKSLHDLRISNSDSESLPENMECLTSLKYLWIDECNKIKDIPTLPKSLYSICIYSCHVLSSTCQEQGHGNWQKIQKVPKKNID